MLAKIQWCRTSPRSATVWVLLDASDNSMQVQTQNGALVQNIGGREFLNENVRFIGFAGTRALPFDLMGRPALATNVVLAVGAGVTRQVIINAAGRVTVQ